MKRHVHLVALAAAGVAALLAPAARADLHHGVVWYTNAADSATLSLAASRYEVGVTGPEFPQEKAAMKSLHPGFRWFFYNSGTDNFVPPHTPTPEDDRLTVLALEKGWDPEEAYLHYVDDTQVVLEGDTLLVPGWPEGSALSGTEARIPVYTKTLTRRLSNFSTPEATALHKQVLIELTLDSPFAGTSVYPDGIFLDNAAFQLFNFGTVISGGHVKETPGHLSIVSTDFQAWQWNQNLGPFLTALKDTLETSATWSKDGRRKQLMINVSNIWDDSYVTRDVTDILFMEFQYNVIRAFGTQEVAEAYRRDSLAAAAGITSFYAPTMTRSVLGHPEVMNYEDALLGNLAWYLTTRTDSTLFFEFGSSSPNAAGWDSLTWRGCLDVADSRLGKVAGPPYILDQGKDPLGYDYVVTARSYEHGLALVRNRGNWDQGIELAGAVSVPLPGLLYPVHADGTWGSAVSSVSVRNGQGMLFLTDPVPVTLLSSSAVREAEGVVLTWETAGEAADHAGFHVYRGNAAGGRDRISTHLLTGSTRYRFVDTRPPATSTRYWLADLSRSGTISWLGPLSLGPAVAEPAMLRLAQNRPNPFRAGTAIRFSLPRAGAAHLRVHDLAGRVVAVLVDGDLPAGDHTASWNGRDARGAPVAPGVYFYVLTVPGARAAREMIRLP